MYDIQQKHYILRMASENIYNVFFQPNSGICLSLLKKGTLPNSTGINSINYDNFRWCPPVVIQKNSLPNFSACLDKSDNIHILYQDTKTNISHIALSNSSIIKTIYQASNRDFYNKYPSIYCTGKTLYYFYILEYSKTSMLLYQTLAPSGEIQKPHFIDYIRFSKAPYRIVKDAANNLYVFYSNSCNGSKQIGYRKIPQNSDIPGDFEPLVDSAANTEILSSSVDFSGSIHLCYSRKALQEYELTYVKKNPSIPFITSTKVLSVSPNHFYHSSMLVIEDKIIVYWVKNNNIFYCFSPDNGYTWKMAESYSFYNNSSLFCIEYLTHTQSGLEKTCFQELPGILSDSFKLAFIDDFFPKPVNMVIDDMKLSLITTAKSVSQNILHLQQCIEGISLKIEQLEQRQKELEMKTNLYNTKEPAPEEKITNKTVQENGLPLMPGSGFGSITPQYLEELRKK